MKKFHLLYAPLLASSLVYADFNKMKLGFGSLTEAPKKYQMESGTTKTFDFLPVVSMDVQYQMTPSWSISPKIGVTFPYHGRDEQISKLTYFLSGDVGYNYDIWQFRIGSGMYLTYISSDGGSQTLNNGSSQTSFPRPSGGATSRNITANAGVSVNFHENWYFATDFFVMNAFSELNKSLNYILSVQYDFGDQIWKK